MCVLTMKRTNKIMYGFKVVAIDKKTSKRYSIAMGFCYDNYKTIPNVSVQNGISGYFWQDILNDNDSCYEANMIGRTALFDYLSDAKYLCSQIQKHFTPQFYPGPREKKYRLAIMYCSIEEDIMSGSYGENRVIAGRKLIFLREATND